MQIQSVPTLVRRFAGSPVEQARCLLRFVKRAGEVGDTPTTLPQALENLLSDAQNLGINSAQIRLNLHKRGIPESTVGGPVGDRVCHADSDNPAAPLARYFVIHDTSPTSSLRPRFFGWRAEQREVTHWNCWTGSEESAPFAKIVTKSYVIFT